MATTAIFALVTLLLCHITIHAASNANEDVILIEDFAVEPNMYWYPVNDPLVGGNSSATIVLEDGLGKLSGKVVTWDRVKGAGFVGMQAQDLYPDVSTCEGLEIYGRSLVPYRGYEISFGTEHADTMKYGRGYKAPLRFQGNTQFEHVKLSFSEFSDNWNELTGELNVKCVEDHKYCPKIKTLQNLAIMGIWGEGETGLVNLELKNITAYDCVTDNDGDLFKSFVNIFSSSSTPEDDPVAVEESSSVGYIVALCILTLAVFSLALLTICKSKRMQSRVPEVGTKPVMKETNPEDQIL